MTPAIQITAVWIAIAAGLIDIGHNVDQWMDEEARRRFSESIQTKLNSDWAHWAQTINNAFVTFFDGIYRKRLPDLDRALWQSVLFGYAILTLARVVLKLFRIPVPPTSSILGIALVVAVGGTLFMQAFRAGGKLIVKHHLSPLGPQDMVRTREFRSVVGYGTMALFVYTAAAIITGYRVGVSVQTVTAIAFGAAMGVPTMLAITMIPDRVLPISPLSALVSSVLSLALLSVFFRSAAHAFVSDFGKEHWRVGSLLLFNLFADMVSLIETRWVLSKSGKKAFLSGIIAMLVLDLLLSAAIFLILPGIADQQLGTLLLGILFKGPLPWLGILFWSTFATSFLFYLFVASVVVLRLAVPLFAGVRSVNKWFPVYEHPVRLVSIVIVGLISGALGLLLLVEFVIR